jgi:hypothetical protein
VGTVTIPVIMTLPPGMTNWVQDQYFSYSIDNSSTAEYGVDYMMSGGQFSFYKNIMPSPYMIPVTIIQDSVPKNKTLIIKLKAGSSIASLGAITTYTYTISNPGGPHSPTVISSFVISNNSVSIMVENLSAGATNRILRCQDLTSSWSTVYTFSGSGQTHWSDEISNTWRSVFYKVSTQ